MDFANLPTNLAYLASYFCRKLNQKILCHQNIKLSIVGFGMVPAITMTGRSHLAEDYMAMEGFHYGDYAHVRCSALAEMEHVEDYFFGHQKGAYASAVQSTDGILEKARNSFLFLENVDEMPLSENIAPMVPS